MTGYRISPRLPVLFSPLLVCPYLTLTDRTGSMLKYIEWDGQGFLQGKRRAQSGTYPWPKGQAGETLEISEKEFEYLLSRSIVPFKTQKGL